MTIGADQVPAPEAPNTIAVTASTPTSEKDLNDYTPTNSPVRGYWTIKWMADDANGICYVKFGATGVAEPTASNAWPLRHGEEASWVVRDAASFIRILGGASAGDVYINKG